MTQDFGKHLITPDHDYTGQANVIRELTWRCACGLHFFRWWNESRSIEPDRRAANHIAAMQEAADTRRAAAE